MIFAKCSIDYVCIRESISGSATGANVVSEMFQRQVLCIFSAKIIFSALVEISFIRVEDVHHIYILFDMWMKIFCIQSSRMP